ncbi:MAG: serine hydrolase, partial [Deinococcota bacterium]
FRDNLYLGYNAETAMHAASLIKLPVMLEVLSQCDMAECDLDTRITLEATQQVSGSGVLHALGEGLALSIRDLVTLMMIVSDNTATNMLIDHVGVRAINRRIQSLGLAKTRLVGKLQLSEEEQNREQRKGERNTTCANAMLALLVKLQQSQLMSDEMTQLALNILHKQQFTEALARYLPTDAELADTNQGVRVASKSGCLRGVWHDAGLVSSLTGEPLYGLVIMTRDSRDRSFSFEQEGMMTIARLSKAIFEVYMYVPPS